MARIVSEPRFRYPGRGGRSGRRASGGGASDGRPELLERQRQAFEELDDGERASRLQVDTTERPREAARSALRAIHRRLL